MINPTSNINTSIFYVNDYHGKTINMERTVTASNAYDSKYKNRNDVDTLKLSSGDIMIGEDNKINKLAVTFLKMIGIQACAVGNHECDMQTDVEPILDMVDYDIVTSNMKTGESNPWNKVIKSSVIKEENGHKYGIIGTSPTELDILIKDGPIKSDTFVSNSEKTIQDVQKEVDKLRQQGIDKIILISHSGYSTDVKIAQQTSGIDVIIGGHTHDLIFDIKEGKNLFYSKTGEPVVITQAGRDGKYFGVLNLEFSPDGIIKKVQNNVGFTTTFRRNAAAKDIFDNLYGEIKTYGSVKSAPPPVNKDLTEQNPHAYFIADCIRKDLNTDIAILPSSNIRGYFETGKIDSRTLADVLPFKNKLYVMKYSEADIVDAIKQSCKSFTNEANKPGIFYTSGLKYKVTNEGKVLTMEIADKNGSYKQVDVNNPRKDKFYTVAINDYCAQGNDGFTSLNQPQNIIKKCPFDATKCVIDVLNNTKDEVEIYDDGRIEIIYL